MAALKPHVKEGGVTRLLSRAAPDPIAHLLAKLNDYFGVKDDRTAERVRRFPSAYQAAAALSAQHSGGARKSDKDEVPIALGAIMQALRAEKAELGAFGTMETPSEWEDIGLVAFADPLPKDAGHKYVEADPQAPLFAGPPKISDVRQGGLNDCYLLAAIGSIVDSNPDHFVRHITDNLDGSVSVKFYAGPGQPLYVRVAKSVVGNTYARGALWVKLLEKAYAASTLQGSKASYEDLETTGRQNEVLLHLTGVSSTEISGTKAKEELLEHLSTTLKSEATRLMSSSAGDESATEHPGSGQQEIPGQSLALAAAELAEPRFFTQQEIVGLIKPLGLDNDIAVKLIARISDTFPGPIGSGRYGADEYRLVSEIMQGCDDKSPMIAFTKGGLQEGGSGTEGTGETGEAKVRGLASPHAYSVLDYRPKDDVFGSGKPIEVLLRNPWGHYGREYKKEQGTWRGVPVDNVGSDLFWIELADFSFNFSTLVRSGASFKVAHSK